MKGYGWQGQAYLLLTVLLGLGALVGAYVFVTSLKLPARLTAVPRPQPTATAAWRIEAGLSDLIPPGRRALAVTFAEAQGEGRPIESGDTVDVLAVFPGELIEQETEEPVVLLSDVLVLAVTQTSARGGGAGEERAAEAAGTARETPVPDLKTAVLAVTPEEAQVLALVQQSGQLRLVRRPAEGGSRAG